MFNKKSAWILSLNDFDVSTIMAGGLRVLNMVKIINEIVDVTNLIYPSSTKNKNKKIENYRIYRVKRSENIKFVSQIFNILFVFITFLVKHNKDKKIIVYTRQIFLGFLLSIYSKINHKIVLHFDILGILYKEIEKSREKKFIFYFKKLLFYLMLKFICSYKHQKKIITTINNQHRIYIYNNLCKSNIYIIRDAINKDKYKFINKTNKLLYLSRDCVNMIFVGKITHRRLDNVFEVVKKIIKKIPYFNFYIIGSGPDKDYYANISKKLGLHNNIFFLGYISNEKIPFYLKEADICYSDVWSDIGFPMKVFEYMAAGKVAIVKNCGSTQEVIKDMENGVLYDDDEDLKKKLSYLIKNKNVRERIGKNARKDVFTNHTWKQRKEKLRIIYLKFWKSD